MRICSPQIGLSSHSRLGGAVYDYQVLRHLAELGVEIDIPHLLAPDVDVVPGWRLFPMRIRRFYRLGGLLTNLAFAISTFQIASKRRPDLIRIAYPWYSGPSARLVSRLTGIKTVAAFHHLEEEEGIPHRSVHRWIARRSDGVHVGSRFAARQIADRYGVRPERLEVIPYGVDERYTPDEEHRQRLRRERGIDDRTVLLYLGGILARKNLFFLVEAFEKVFQEPSKPLLLLCGEGYPHDDYARRLEERVRKSPARESIGFLGAVGEEEKIALYRACDILVHPSRVEGFGLSVAEAMACGAAVLASDRGSLPEIVEDGRTGCLADVENPRTFADRLRELVRDPPRCREMGRRASADVKSRFTWDRTARDTLRYYRRLVTGESA